VQAIPDILEAIVDMIPEITGQLVDMLPELIDAAFDLFTGIVSGLIDATPDIIQAIIDLIPDITAALIDSIPQLIEAGIELVKGIVKGIVENGPRLVGEAIAGLGNSLVGEFKGALGFESPSKVFAELGGEVVNGLDKGLGDGKNLLAKASVDMAQTLQVSSENVLTSRSGFPVSTGSQSSSAVSRGGQTFNITVNAGMGTDGQRVGQQIVDEILKFERNSGRVFARA